MHTNGPGVPRSLLTFTDPLAVLEGGGGVCLASQAEGEQGTLRACTEFSRLLDSGSTWPWWIAPNISFCLGMVGCDATTLS
jgi:hypothetical protein